MSTMMRLAVLLLVMVRGLLPQLDDDYVYNIGNVGPKNESEECEDPSPRTNSSVFLELWNKKEGGCKTFKGHLWLNESGEFLPDEMSEIRRIIGCITVIDSGHRVINLSSLSLIIYNETKCYPYSIRVINNRKLESIVFRDDFRMPERHLVLFDGKHKLTSQSTRPNLSKYFLPRRSDDCEGEGDGCSVIYGTHYYQDILKFLPTLKRIEGQLIIEGTNLTNLSILEKVTIIGLQSPALILRNNRMVSDVTSIYKMKIDGVAPVLQWFNNGPNNKWCRRRADIVILSRLSGQPYHEIITPEIVEGGSVDQSFLYRLNRECKCLCEINGDLEIKGLDVSTIDLSPLERISAISGRLRIFNNTGLTSLLIFENLREVGRPKVNEPRREPTIEVFDNEDLVRNDLPGSVKTPSETCFRSGFSKEVLDSASKNHFIEKATHWPYPVSRQNVYNGSACFADPPILKRVLASVSEKNPCRHFYGHLKFDDYTGPIQQASCASLHNESYDVLKDIESITGCLDIGTKAQKRSIDFRSLKLIKYDSALCETFYALRIMGRTGNDSIIFHDDFRFDVGNDSDVKDHVFFRGNSNKIKLLGGAQQLSGMQVHEKGDCYMDDRRKKNISNVQNCRVLIGDLKIERSGSKDNIKKWLTNVTQIHGKLTIAKSPLHDLKAVEHITILPHSTTALVIENNDDLERIGGLVDMNITGPKWYKEKIKIIVRNNGWKLCHGGEEVAPLQELVYPANSIQFGDFCRKKCPGGVFDGGKSGYRMEDLRECHVILGTLIIRNNDFSSSSSFYLLNNFERIEYIEGSLIVTNNTGIQNLTFFVHLNKISDTTTTRPIIQIVGNPNLTSIHPLYETDIEYVDDDVDVVALIETYSEIDRNEQEQLKENVNQKAVFRVLDKKSPSVADAKAKKGYGAGGRRTHKPQDKDTDNLGTGIALTLGAASIFAILGYGYTFIVYLREKREYQRQQQLIEEPQPREEVKAAPNPAQPEEQSRVKKPSN